MGVYDVLPQVLWTQHFLEAQGYSVKDCMIYQDNMSTILLAENSKASSSKLTRQINIRYFFVTDLVKKGQVKVTHCPTEDMVSDYFTKPLQGSAFRKLRQLIMNTDEKESGPSETCRSVLERDQGAGSQSRTGRANQETARHVGRHQDGRLGPPKWMRNRVGCSSKATGSLSLKTLVCINLHPLFHPPDL
jgi:hypothetical protein